jgi:uncharacterized protein (TIGR00730 family)
MLVEPTMNESLPAPIRSICVFCGSSIGSSPIYVDVAERTGRLLARSGITVVFGGGGVGLMGALADAALDAGGEVIGVIPEQLVRRELGHRKLSELLIVVSMHERKATMAEISDAFIALPGGAGTLEEFCEIWTWAQLGIHAKPVGLLNVEGYYSTLLTFLDEVTGKGFLSHENRDLILVESEPAPMLDRLRAYRRQAMPQWLRSEAT